MTGKITGSGAGKRYFLDKKEVTEAEFYEAFPPVKEFAAEALSSTPPHKSDGLACHPNQVQEAMDWAKKRGVPTDFTKDGRPIMTSRAHQKAYLKAFGYYNRDGGYGD